MSLRKARASVGLTAPTARQKEEIWGRITVPSARIYSGYKPVPEIEKVHFNPARIRLLSGGARLGKSLFMAMEALPWVFHSDLIWLLGPDYSQTRQEFLYMVEALVSIGATNASMISFPQSKSQPCSLETTWGCQVETMTTQDPEKIASKAPDMILLCEPGQIQDEIWDRASERVTTRRGGIVLAGTFEDNTYVWFQDAWMRWRKWPNDEDAKSFSVPMWANTYTFPEGKDDPEVKRLEATMPRDQFLRRIAGIPTPSRKLILADVWRPKLSDGTPHHVGYFPFTRKDSQGNLNPVEIFIDPGWGSESYYYVGAVQKELDENNNVIFKVIDEIVVQHMTHQQVAQLAMSKMWWNNVAGGVAEPWGGDNHSLGNATAIEAWAQHSKVHLRAAERLPLDDRIAFLRDVLHDPTYDKPMIFFNESSTPHIQNEISHWRRRNTRADATRPPKPSDLGCDGVKALASYLTEQTRITYGSARPVVRDVEYVV